MAYTGRDAIAFVYPLLSQNGATRAVGANNFLRLLNLAITQIYNHEGYVWSWQHCKEGFALIDPDKNIQSVVTKHPIKLVDKFFTTPFQSPYPTIDDCSECRSDDVVAYRCDSCVCGPECKPLKLSRLRPHSELCPGTYQIAGSEISQMGGLQGRIVRAYVGSKVNNLWITYYRNVKHLTSFDDIVPLPDNFMLALTYFIAAMIVPHYGQSAAGQELNYYNLGITQLESLKKDDNEMPDRVEWDSDYPFEEPRTSSASFTTNRNHI